jgi:hypothetical protein
MAPRSNPTETEKRLDQLERDMAAIARAVWPHVHPKSELLEILERHNVGGQETRPHKAEESRERVTA